MTRGRGRLLIGVLVVSAAAQAAPGAAARVPSAPPAVVARATVPTAAGVRAVAPRDAQRRQFRDGLAVSRAAGPAAVASGAAAAFQESPVKLLPAGDFDGNGVRDLLELRDGAKSLGVHARDAVTGRLLWSRVLPRAAGELLDAFPARTGRAGTPGVVVLRYRREQRSTYVRPVLVVSALDRRGRQVWSHRSTGAEYETEDSERWRSAPWGAYILPLRRGANDVVVVLSDGESDAYNVSAGYTLLRVSGTDGRAARLGTPFRSADTYPLFGVVPDQSGDGYDDVYLSDPGDADLVEVRSGATGRRVWSTTALPGLHDLVLDDAGPITGARAGGRAVRDLTLVTDWPADLRVGPLTVPVADPATSRHGQVALVRGGSGRVVWTKPGDVAMPIERVGKRPAVAVVTDYSPDPGSNATPRATIAAYDAAGAEIWTATASDSTPGAGIGIDLLGDVEPDGSRDLWVRYVDEDWNWVNELRRGRDGAVLPTDDAMPLPASVDGKGHDAFEATIGNALTVSVRDVGTGRRLFRRTLPGPGAAAQSIVAVSAAHTTSRRCADVLVTAAGPRRGVVAVVASSGALRWYVSSAVAETRAGRPVRPRTPARGRC